ncbi:MULTISPECIES: sulfatase-like hydrolase/transferase [unclassified Caballeronia]|uniref:sulfatase-like hydrolase/transferase n=1 Tax=unclassified Caballeronia TaxID=2646786 RepID=UPI0025402F75|nr:MULTISPECIES: sulfatase-like hydrolase/transferase [unclassified Caballeronia]
MANLLFICVDQMRYDALSCNGNTVNLTPNLDRIARRGIAFDRHYTPNQICSPSRATMATGLYPRHHGLCRNGMALPEDVPTLWQILRTKRLQTHAVGKLHYQPLLASSEHKMPESLAFWANPEAPSWHGPFYGFGNVELVLGEANESTKAGHYATWLKANHPSSPELFNPGANDEQARDLKEVWKSGVPADQHYTNWIADRTIEIVEDCAKDKSPFCVFMSFPDPHHPFTPPRPYCDLFSPSDVALPLVVPGELDRMPEYMADGDDPMQDAYIPPGSKVREQGFMLHTDRIAEETIRTVIAHTYGSVRMIDDAVGRVLETLERDGLMDDTYIVFTADHGEFLGEHGLLRKGPPPYRQLLQVPFLMCGPEIKGGVRSDALTSHLDLLSTFCDLYEMTSPANDGVSLVDILNGKRTDVREHLFAEYHPRADDAVYNQSVITKSWRCTVYPNMPNWGELFFLDKDPGEHWNLFGEVEETRRFEEMRRLLASRFPAAPKVSGMVYGAY